jgi:thioredoxin 1
MIGPVIEELADEYVGKAKIGKLNADENNKPTELGVSGIPTMIIFKDGQEVDRIVGVVPKNTMVEKLDYYLMAN